MIQSARHAPKAFYSGEFYDALAMRWRGIGGGFIVLLALIETIVFSTMLLAGKHELAKYVPQLMSQLPEVTFDKGKIAIDRPSPVTIRLGEGDDEFITVIDTSFSKTDMDEVQGWMQENHVSMLFTADKMITLNPHTHEMEVHPLPPAKEGDKPVVITHADWQTFMDIFMAWMVPVSMLFMLLWFMLAGLFLVVLGGLLVKVVALIRSRDIDYAGCMRIASAARLPAVTIGMLIMLLGTSMLGIIKFVIWIGYVIFAVDNAVAPKEEFKPL